MDLSGSHQQVVQRFTLHVGCLYGLRFTENCSITSCMVPLTPCQAAQPLSGWQAQLETCGRRRKDAQYLPQS
jgi:hypothetical protein